MCHAYETLAAMDSLNATEDALADATIAEAWGISFCGKIQRKELIFDGRALKLNLRFPPPQSLLSYGYRCRI